MITTGRPTLPPGKVPWDLIARRLPADLPEEVLLGPALGEDAALLRLGGETWALATDPISFTAVDAGRLSVIVNANDVAVRGARPMFFVAVVLLSPSQATEERVAEILGQIRSSCDHLGVALVGGHTEVTPGIPHSLVVGTMLGRVQGRALTTGGLKEGDWVGISKWAGLEGTSILLTEYGDRLGGLHPRKSLRSLAGILPGEWLSVVPEASLAAQVPGVSALHDVTEGGVGEALHELGRACQLTIRVSRTAVPILPETRLICRDFGMDPLGLIGSGALLVGCAPAAKPELSAVMDAAGIHFSWLGRATAAAAASRDAVPRFERDEILKTGLLDGVQAVLFDMDGTLIDSDYDWPTIRSRLDVTAGTIIDHLNGLASEERERRWAELRAIERSATAAARPAKGAAELLSFLRTRGLRTALVTNNDDRNTHDLLDRFGLAFDLVLTRDSGLWKPSGAPLQEALVRLRVTPDHCCAVGDSHYDLLAAREAGCKRVCLLREPDDLAREADISFPDAAALLRYVKLVL